MSVKSAHVKNERQYEALKDRGMSKQRAAKISNSPPAAHNGGKASGSGGNPKQSGTTAEHKAAGRKGGRSTSTKNGSSPCPIRGTVVYEPRDVFYRHM